MLKVERYSAEHQHRWNDFVRGSKNGTFLFNRDYMDYHRDRFDDYSLMVWDEKHQLVAILPANRSGLSLVSHSGLTYGGFVVDLNMKTPVMLEIFEAVLSFLQAEGFTELIYKTIPHVYHMLPSEEDRYALFLCQAQLLRSSVMAVTEMQSPLPFQERRKRSVKKAVQSGVEVRFNADIAEYWPLLSSVLMERHNAHPVHSLSEILMLKQCFPEQIKMYSAYFKHEIVAGVVVFETERVARMQYIAANTVGRDCGALDLIFSTLVHNIYSAKSYIDFGTSNEDDGRILNKGLIDQKEGFGARAIAHEHYRIDLTNFVSGQIRKAIE